MEFEVCNKKKQYFFISSALVLANEVELKMKNDNRSNKMIDFDEIFFGYPVSKSPNGKNYPI